MEIVGHSRPIHDAKGKATGSTRYVADLSLPDMAHIAMVFSTIPHGTILAIDTTKAKEIEGVYEIYHHFNTPEHRYNHYRSQFQGAQVLPMEESVFGNYVRFVGDRVAAVVAVDEETARYAASLVEVTYQSLPHAVDFDTALRGEHCLEGQSPICDEGTITVGEPTQAEEDGITVTISQEVSRIHHAAMETHACIADYDPHSDHITLYSANQAVFGIRTVVADMLEMPYNRVRVVKTTMGGSFGGKQEWMLEPLTALCAKLSRRPVKLVYNRAETMQSTYCRAAMRGEMHGVFAKDGTLLRVDLDILLDAGAYIGNSFDYVRAPFGKLFRCYRIPHVNLHSRVVSTNTTPSGAFRSWGVAEYFVFMEQLLNKAAEICGIDPVVLRQKNVLVEGDRDIKMDLPVEKARTLHCLTQGKEQFSWAQKQQQDAQFNQENKRYKRGTAVACAGHTNTYYKRFNDFAGAEVRMCEDGTLIANVAVHDHGCGTVEAFKMILAETMEIHPDKITIHEADTAYTPFDYGCFSSRSTFVNGRAVELAGQNMRQLLLETASSMLDVPVDKLYIENATIRQTQNSEVALSYKQLSQWAILNLRKELFAVAQHQNHSNPTVTGTHFAQVEVDTWTGMIRVIDYLALHDVGRAINPAMCRAQVQGAVQMGIGAALTEEYTYASNGKSVNSLAKYHLVNCPDLPHIGVTLVEDGPSDEGPFGAKSIGEVALAPVAAVVVGAVNCAVGGGLTTIPITPDRVMEHLAKENNP